MSNKAIIIIGFFVLIGFSMWVSDSLIPLWLLLFSDSISDFVSEKTENENKEFLVTVNRTFNHGYRNLWFKKTFRLPYAPFYDMCIIDQDNDQEITIRLDQNNYISSSICYYPTTDETSIDVREIWRDPVRDDVVDEILQSFDLAGWERMDDTDEEEFKKFMHEQYLKTT